MKFNKITNVITLGFALFAMFFGAGNLILPPFIGLKAGDEWLFNIFGFATTGVIAPFLGILAVVLSGNSFTDLGKRVSTLLALSLGVIIMLGIGPLVAIPRTAATTYEIGVLSLFPNFSPILSSILFFAITLALSISSSKIVNIIGIYLTPVLILLLVILVVSGIISPVDPMIENRITAGESFSMGFREGYQTMDVLAAVIFAGIIISAAKMQGYKSIKERSKIVVLAGIVAVSCLVFIYGGLIYLGASSGYELTPDLKRTDLLLYISTSILGKWGTLAMALCIALACLTTAIALTCAVGTFFEKLTYGKLNYKAGVIICSIISAVLAVRGVDEIIDYAVPFLSFAYPITLSLVLYVVIFGKFVKRRAAYIGAVAITSFISALKFIKQFNIAVEPISYFDNLLPFAQYDLSWLVPSFVFFILFLVVDKYILKSKIDESLQ